MVFGCTICGAAAQVLMKIGAEPLRGLDPFHALLAMFTNVPLICAYALYGGSVVLMTLALRDGELSSLYPVISLTYVWVAFLSVAMFHESISLLKACGLGSIIAGVAFLGRGSKAA